MQEFNLLDIGLYIFILLFLFFENITFIYSIFRKIKCCRKSNNKDVYLNDWIGNFIFITIGNLLILIPSVIVVFIAISRLGESMLPEIVFAIIMIFMINRIYTVFFKLFSNYRIHILDEDKDSQYYFDENSDMISTYITLVIFNTIFSLVAFIIVI